MSSISYLCKMEPEEAGSTHLQRTHSVKEISICLPTILSQNGFFGNFTCATIRSSSSFSMNSYSHYYTVRMSYHKFQTYLSNECDYFFLDGLIDYDFLGIYRRFVERSLEDASSQFIINCLQSFSVSNKELVISFLTQKFGTTNPDGILKIIKSRAILDFSEEISPSEIMEALFEILSLKLREEIEIRLKKYIFDSTQSFITSTTNNMLDLKDYLLSTIIIDNK